MNYRSFYNTALAYPVLYSPITQFSNPMSRSNQQQTPGGNRPPNDSAKPRKYTRYSDGTRRASTSSNISIRSAVASGGASHADTPPPASQTSALDPSRAATTSSTTNNEPGNSRLTSLQDALDTLYDEWMSVEIVFQSMQNAFPVAPLAALSHEGRLDDIDRELSIAYDDLMVQVRRIHRNLNRLSHDMAHFRATKLQHNQRAAASSSSSSSEQQQQQPQDRAHDDNIGRTTASQ
ncbi:hypothetical protein O0I10_010640 [Lichtheimia ornata]|uniref:Uncharacterized protein n=1 Tax=Lichtheimia ornata TaxID=688661 RepID=A0AAD7UUB7_9FUNG|nr:uncharacterized protein O0I10_010640 [Lichtheimia ornata]KAJ8653718.1 hypothetical protein O0I10_010640 [Lichtheimia ornata]